MARETTRREVLRQGVGAAAFSLAGRVDARGDDAPPASSGRSADDALDEALGLLQRREPESKQGLSTHAPMAAEALCALGHPERAVPWVEAYRAPVIELPRPGKRIDREDWRAALGPRPGAGSWEAALERWGDWKEFFAEELANAPWPTVLDTWAARLAPGLCAAATHGVIRTAHAARGLGARESAARRGELARGLAYWASAYQELPARALGGPRAATYPEAIDRLPLFWEERGQAPTGNIVAGLSQVGGMDRFLGALDLVTEPDDVSAALSALSATFARAYLRHGTQHHTIAFVHAVTGPCALRRLLPHVKPETARAALPYAWQAAAAIYTAYARKEDAGPWPEPRLGRAELIARAVENGDEHAIKFTEVLLAEHALRPDPVYLAAAEDAVNRL